MTRQIETLLIANRGEIALRVIRTARRMGIRAIAVFSDVDAGAAHVAAADAAMRIGGGPARESYLNVPAILAAAKAGGATAIHPGYGFLAENADFAEACAAAGLIFVGPPAAAIRAMGGKSRARALMAKTGIPIVPGYHGEDQSLATLRREAAAIGFPLLLKASAGGGGKGMRIVESGSELESALESAQREAEAAFGDKRMILERYVARPRHVEVQIFADQSGRVVHLFERDCSIQRRHQKVIEEAPAPGLSPSLRAALRDAAIACARSVAYSSAGTVEFLVAGDQFYFMEMNTRLQVEHPVTEAITGIDLVEWQIRVAQGEALPLAQGEIAERGHAIEARLCAEDPRNGFLPQTGRLEHFHLPVGLPGLRLESGVREGDEVAIHYDPLLAKIVAHGRDRAEATARLRQAIAAGRIAGVATNRAFLVDLLSLPAFAAEEVDTGFIERHRAALFADKRPDERAVAAAAFAVLEWRKRSALPVRDPADPFSPWRETSGWRLGGRATADVQLLWRDEPISITALHRRDGYELCLPGATLTIAGEMLEDGAIAVRIDDALLRAHAVIRDGRLTLFMDGNEHEFAIRDPFARRHGGEAELGRLASPMPGIVVAVLAAAGDSVAKGAPLVMVEAMKMEHAITAPHDGKVRAVHVAVGDQVAAGAELAALESPS